VDEVNLLDDGLVDVVLDSAASGINTVEREGISIVHPAKFIMIGSGNPQEGELRPQLLDRFGMSVQVKTLMVRRARAGGRALGGGWGRGGSRGGQEGTNRRSSCRAQQQQQQQQ
jgi:hypothetical protein